ncbi:unnamed protein product [Phaedon cochleariae]|uniref:Complex 1 LYR protein domain-containing protein n=1 Tax=Phaedon cochleariae TaxID=80249 RepID=A0A9N9SJW9_PHACE|nr:unnamed protein product [Phaedon cochleariae]
MSRINILNLYKTMLKESKKIPSYNFRKYALRRVHDGFKENKGLRDPDIISEKITECQRNLEIIKRQAIIGHLYNAEKLVIEH